jgi:predicted XRE-type DNA-binding protein
MLDSILNSVKDQVGKELIDKAGVSEHQIDDIFKIAGESTQDVMAGKLSPDMLEGVMNLFSKGSNNSLANGIQNDLINTYVSKLISKLGLSQSTAKTIAAIAIPKIIELVSGENEKTPPSDMSALLNMFGGGSGSGSAGGALGDALGGLFK